MPAKPCAMREVIGPRATGALGGGAGRCFPACVCVSPRAVMAFCSWINRSARISRCSASSAEKPRSRNTLPLDGVTFRLFFLGIVGSLLEQRAEAIARQLHIVWGRFPGALLECME